MILGMVVCVVAVVIVFVIGLFLFPEPKAQPITDDTILHIPVRDIKVFVNNNRNAALEEAANLCNELGFIGAAENIRALKK